MAAALKEALIKIQNALNGLLYVKPKKTEDMPLSEGEIFELKKEVSKLLFEVVSGEKTVLYALSNFPKYQKNNDINVCFHILAHFEADEDLRAKDPLYKEEQDNYILYIANLLQKGESIPVNIINEYNEYYKETLVYPIITKKTIIERLKKSINF